MADLVFPVQGEAIDYPQIAPKLAAPEPVQQTIPVSIVQATEGALDPAKQPAQIAPMDQLAAQRIGEHATQPFAPNIAPPEAPPQKADPGDLTTYMRFEYGRALQQGEVDGPQDFAERVAGAGWRVASSAAPAVASDPDQHAQITNAASALAGALPTHEDLIDHSIALSNSVFGDATPASVAVIKQNLLDTWADTGISIPQLVRAAMRDTDLAAQIATPPPLPPGQRPTFPTGVDIKHPDEGPIDPIGTQSTSYHSNFTDMLLRAFPMAAAIKGSFEGVSGQEPPASKGTLDKLQQIPEGLGWLIGKQVKNTGDLIKQMMDPDFQRRLQVGDVTPQERIDMLSAAAMGVGMKPSGTLGSGVGRILSPEGKAAVDAATTEKVRQGIGSYFPTVKSQSATEARATIKKAAGLSRAAQSIATDLIEEWRPQVNRLLPEDRVFRRGMKAYATAWQAGKEAWIAAGNHPDAYQGPPGLQPPPLSRLQALRDHVEDRPGGGRVTGSELEPLANFLRDAFLSMKGEIEQHFDINSFVEHYLPHQYKDQSAFAKAFGSSRRGDPSALNRRSIPYLYDAMLRGLELKHPDVLDSLFHYVQGTMDYIEHEGVLHTGEATGQVVWNRSGSEPPVPGWQRLRDVWRDPKKRGHEKGEPPQLRIGTDVDRDIEMANKIEGPEAQTNLPGRNLPAEAQPHPSETQAQLGHNRPPEPLQIEGPVKSTEAQQKTGYQRRRMPQVEYAWAHPGYATIYNNWAGSGFFNWPRIGPIVQKLIAASNMSTAFKLALTAAHAFNIADAMISSGFANAFGEIAHGEIARGIKDLGMSVAILPRFVSDMRTGKNFQNIYLGKKADLTPTQQKMRDAFIESGGRPLGRGQEMAIGQAKNIVTVWRQGGGWPGLREHLIQRTGEPGEKLGIWKAVGAGSQLVGDIMHTVSGPLFDNIIPRLKAAAFANEMAAYIRSHPDASHEELTAAASEINAAKDDIYGELNSENVFLPRWVKQTAQIGLLSQSWKYGTWRAFGRGATDIVTGNWNTSRAKWILGTVLSYGLIATIAEVLYTGHGPRNLEDIYRGPPSGGTYPSGKGFSGDEERLRWLGPFKEFMDIYSGVFAALHSADPTITAVRSALGYIGGAGAPITKAATDFFLSEPGQHWFAQMIQDVAPILQTQQYKQGTNIGGFGRFLGFQPQSRAIGDPTALGYILDKAAEKAQNTQDWKDYYRDQELAEPTGVPKPKGTPLPRRRKF